jgi:hypothetical protein
MRMQAHGGDDVMHAAMMMHAALLAALPSA